MEWRRLIVRNREYEKEAKGMNICIISYKYPGKHNTSDYAFVKQLVDAIAQLGHHCHVIAPFNISHYHRFSVPNDEYRQGKGVVTVYRPGYLSFSNFHIGGFYPSMWFHDKALNRAFRMMDATPDAIYCHFWRSGYMGYRFAKSRNIPLFVASGESEIKKMFPPKSDVTQFATYVKGVICVSSKNRNESVELGLTVEEKCIVLPNAVNKDLFHKIDKKACRMRLGFPVEGFIVAFVGWFIERKGPVRVAEAIKRIDGEKVYSIFIGKGNQTPDCNNILFKGPLQHGQVPEYLNAADIFVLPTLHEGCCNAVVEAMACGLPVVSSNRPFNWDVLNSSNSILVDPTSVEEIASAIQSLRDDKDLQQRLSEGALKKAESLTIDKRSMAIMHFIAERLNINNNSYLDE